MCKVAARLPIIHATSSQMPTLLTTEQITHKPAIPQQNPLWYHCFNALPITPDTHYWHNLPQHKHAYETTARSMNPVNITICVFVVLATSNVLYATTLRAIDRRRDRREQRRAAQAGRVAASSG